MAIGKMTHLSSTYDHRIIQGAASGCFLSPIDKKLSGTGGFYERVFTSLHVPVNPYAWEMDVEYDPGWEKGKSACIAEPTYVLCSRGHLATDIDPLAYRMCHYPDLDMTHYGLPAWDFDRPLPTGGLGGAGQTPLRDTLTRLYDTYSWSLGTEYIHIQDPEQHA